MNLSPAAMGGARRLPTRMVEKVWGRANLPAPFGPGDGDANSSDYADAEKARIGEIWFEPPPEMADLLVKYLFTSEKLSVQVHPSIHNALPGEEGKEECWLVLDAKPGAKLAIGFDESHPVERIEAAARDGSIEELLTWHDARAGDIFYLPAGTVHAIGAGLALVEVQQSSDTTFRLYDYGRPRELHLERALAVADCKPYPPDHASNVEQRGVTLIDAPHFRLDRIEGAPDEATKARYDAGVLALPLEGELTLLPSGEVTGPGECLYAPSLSAIEFSPSGVTLLTRSQ
ncbi:MAG: class I mannose-6-phosphate isomerase [Pseudomonadota bacterium]